MQLDQLNLDSIIPATKTKFKLNMVENALGEHWQVPVMVVKGAKDGPVFGVTAALHGNELNGISIIHRLWDKTKASDLRGTLVLIPVLNSPGFISGQREFYDGSDLNRIMPGKKKGTTSQVYAHNILEKIVKYFDYFVDLHTASFGRVNSLYVRADLSDEVVKKMAYLQEPQIIVNKPGENGTLRLEATKLGIPSITVEIGDPHLLQRKHIRPSYYGINNILVEFGMLDDELEDIEHESVVCKSSKWIYSLSGGILQVFPQLTERVKKDQVIAKITDVFGELVEEVKAPYDSIVVAKSTNPICPVGSRIIHLGCIDQN